MALPAPLPDQLIYLIIRFAAAIPDLPLSIQTPRTTTTLSLKQLIRSNLPPSHVSARLRLIYAGKVLADTTPLSTSLRLPPPSPRRHGRHESGPGSKNKGKQPVQEPQVANTEDRNLLFEAKKYYIHCSLGDSLSPSELATEATLAQTTEASLRSQHQTSLDSSSDCEIIHGNDADRRPSASAATPAPQGFDRLLSSGFTPQEVATLRSQFQNNLSYTHTPDTMPSQTEMRAMEDRWLDSTATDPSSALTGDAEGGWGAGFTVEEGGLDDMLYGYLTGFFWPLGALIWGFREEGVWPRRRQLAVVMGVVLNAAFGFMRWSS
ncbi:hypothetical protein BS50DRAFT_82421 [Corynespora cassiicola Philippines]|uniref:Ubiquitin-like domain-containing protein n=1 Tax=Corynespora cassiicola Philippines TaxID=1448308 RepID=A0A2T2NDL9_CORCC|nr:hypothetical protein BS50DRAFT_82421 [Corynespora cassiicola Philippines]